MEPLHYKNEYVTCLNCGVTYDTQTIYSNNNYFLELANFIRDNLKYYIYKDDETGFSYYQIKRRGETIKYPITNKDKQ